MRFILYQISKNILPIKNRINATNILYTGSNKSFPILWGKCLKLIIRYLYCTKYNEIKICNLYIHENVFHKKWHIDYKYFVYRVTQIFSDPMREMFKAYFNGLKLH